MKIYLAIPYSFDPGQSFEIANEVAAELMLAGYTVFSPISHSHHIADYLNKEARTDHDFWMEQDLEFVKWCDMLWVVNIGKYGMDLIARSRGVQDEIKYAKKLNKPIIYKKYEPK